MKEISASIPAHLMEGPLEAVKPRNTMGKDEFMKLLMAQLQNQDPLKPMDHHEFSAQLAQFSSLEQLTNIGKGIDTLHQGFGDEAKLQALGMMGKKIQATGNEMSLIEGQSLSLSHNLPEGYAPVKASIFDASGKLVREITLAGKANSSEVVWDGKNQDGISVPSGKYSFRVNGVNSQGQSQESGTGLSGVVTGVEINGKNAVLVVQTGSGKSKVELSKVQQVMMEDSSSSKPAAPAVKVPVNPGELPQGIQVASADSAEVEESGEIPLEVGSSLRDMALTDPGVLRR